MLCGTKKKRVKSLSFDNLMIRPLCYHTYISLFSRAHAYQESYYQLLFNSFFFILYLEN